MSKIVWGNTLVKNEDKFIYFAILSVIKQLDKLLIWDTGSTDQTLKIINFLKEKYPEKIDFRTFKSADSKEITRLRQKMLDESKCDFILLIDGDEVWWEESIKKVINSLDKNIHAVVSPVINLVGDIYHFQEEEAGRYQILGKKGHFNIRAINRKIPRLHIKGDYPFEGFYDEKEVLIQNIESKLIFVNAPYLHFSHLKRSSAEDEKTLHRNKFKYEIGNKFPQYFKYPQSLYLDRPDFVSDPWVRSDFVFKIRSTIETPLRKLKRRI